MAMKTNPSTATQATAAFVTPAKAVTVLGNYIEPTTLKPVTVAYDQTNHQINHDVASGAVSPTVTFASYESIRISHYGKNLVRLGSLLSAQGNAQAWYDPLTNTTFVDTLT